MNIISNPNIFRILGSLAVNVIFAGLELHNEITKDGE